MALHQVLLLASHFEYCAAKIHIDSASSKEHTDVEVLLDNYCL